MRRNQGGFTLIELVVVIVILGILAATAIPRFASMTEEARYASAQGVLGAVRSASAIAHAQAVVEKADCTAGTGESVTMEGQAVTLAYCYPTGDSAGIGAAVDADAPQTESGTTATWTVDTITSCKVTYTAATSASGSTPTIAGPAGGSSDCTG